MPAAFVRIEELNRRIVASLIPAAEIEIKIPSLLSSPREEEANFGNCYSFVFRSYSKIDRGGNVIK